MQRQGHDSSPISITNPASWQKAIDMAEGLDDAIVKHVEILHGGFVEPETYAMVMGSLPCARAVIQTQWRSVPAVEMMFFDVRRFEFDRTYDYDSLPEAQFLHDVIDFRLVSIRIVASSAKLTVLDESHLGPGPFPSESFSTHRPK